MDIKAFRVLATLALLIPVITEGLHTFLFHETFAGLLPAASIFSLFLIPVWLLGVAGLWTKNAFFTSCSVFSPFFIGVWGVFLSENGNTMPYGVSYVACALVAALSTLYAHSLAVSRGQDLTVIRETYPRAA